MSKLTTQWVKSTKSGPYSDMCVEVRLDGSEVEVRNSKAPGLGSVRFTTDEWDAFREGVLNGEFRV